MSRMHADIVIDNSPLSAFIRVIRGCQVWLRLGRAWATGAFYFTAAAKEWPSSSTHWRNAPFEIELPWTWPTSFVPR
jgi:hypothetical protein